MNPITLNDLGSFLANILNSYSPYLYFGITFMMAASILVLVRRLLVGVKQ